MTSFTDNVWSIATVPVIVKLPPGASLAPVMFTVRLCVSLSDPSDTDSVKLSLVLEDSPSIALSFGTYLYAPLVLFTYSVP